MRKRILVDDTPLFSAVAAMAMLGGGMASDIFCGGRSALHVPHREHVPKEEALKAVLADAEAKRQYKARKRELQRIEQQQRRAREKGI